MTLIQLVGQVVASRNPGLTGLLWMDLVGIFTVDDESSQKCGLRANQHFI